MRKLTVTYFQRRPYAGHWSIESIFANLRGLLAGKIISKTKIARFTSNGFFKRLYIALEVIFSQADVNHVTGDIHFIATFLKKRKTVLTIHDCGILKDPSFIKRKIFLIFWYWLPSKRVRYITVVSEYSKKELLSYIPTLQPEKVIVIPAFVSDKFRFSPKEFNTEKPVLLHVGTAENKNLLRLAEAIEGMSCKLLIIGVLNKEQIQKLADFKIDYESRSNITDDEIISMYKSADVITFVSTFEGFGMPIIEANRVGRAVLTSNVASMPEVAKNAACIVNPYDVSAIRLGLIKIIENETYRNSIIVNGIENAKRFNSENIALHYYDLYCRVAES